MEDKEVALNLYLESITLDNNFQPISFRDLALKLKENGLQVSKTTLNRWAQTEGWEKKAKEKATQIYQSYQSTQPVEYQQTEITDAIKNLEDSIAISSAILKKYTQFISIKEVPKTSEIELILKIAIASVGMLQKPMERQTDDRSRIRELIKNIKSDDLIEGEVENDLYSKD